MEDKTNGGFGALSGQGRESIGGVSGQELRWSQWWIDHRERVRTIGLGLFIAFDALLVGFGAWGFIDWLAFGGLREEQAIRQMTSPDYGRFPSLTLEEVQIGAPIALSGGAGKLDLLVPVENRNATFWAELEYRFLIDGTAQPLRKAFVLPGEAKYLAELGAPSASGASVELKIEKRVWRRVDLKGASSAEAFASERLNIRAENPVFIPSEALATSPVSSAKFMLVNDSAYGYYDVDVLALLYRGDSIVGAHAARLETLEAGERKPVELFWFQALPQVTKVEAIPSVNIYDPDSYRSPR